MGKLMVQSLDCNLAQDRPRHTANTRIHGSTIVFDTVSELPTTPLRPRDDSNPRLQSSCRPRHVTRRGLSISLVGQFQGECARADAAAPLREFHGAKTGHGVL
jgi:hypothetical protein